MASDVGSHKGPLSFSKNEPIENDDATWRTFVYKIRVKLLMSNVRDLKSGLARVVVRPTIVENLTIGSNRPLLCSHMMINNSSFYLFQC
jgi:hypothetical protein